MADIKQPDSPSERSAADQAREQVQTYGRQARERATNMIEQRKGDAAEWLAGFAQTMRDTGQSLREQDQPTPGQYTQRAADQVDQLADYLRTHDVDRIRGDAESYARAHPAAVLGGALVVGLLAARFLRSSSPGGAEGGGGGAEASDSMPAESDASTQEPREPYPDIANRGGIPS
ncbi:MAG: hypothetical protein WD009_11675 [Phycisphaeraceae bacterium]